MFVAISRFAVANGMSDEVRQAFCDRPHLVDGAQGFLRMEVLTPVDDPDEFWLLTWWSDAESFQAWHKSHLHHESHRGIPKGLRLLPERTVVRGFEQVCT
ncbi:MAG TPA: antibiotic biosynthesis monooxygenase [Thermoanaerobaculia bacterium]|nr:antibiotic biosynthesis monooxygenase [Thermoanaerobaculia bacterium]